MKYKSGSYDNYVITSDMRCRIINVLVNPTLHKNA